MVDEFRNRSADATAEDLDHKVAEAFREDARAQISAMASAVAESCKAEGTVSHRVASLLTCAGRVDFRYPYAPKAGVCRLALEKLGCAAGETRATPEARRMVAEASAQLDSFQEAQTFLKENVGMVASVTSMKAMTRKAAEKTRKAWIDGFLVPCTEVRPSKKTPKGSRYVGPTMLVETDGTGAPCTHADTDGVRGKDGEEAGTREIKVVAIGMYTHVDRNGRPILRRGDVWYFASECSSDELESIMNVLARRRGIGKINRVQFIGDGATWVQKVWEHAFKECGAIRTLDFVHAAGYLHKLLEALSKPGELGTDYKRFKGMLKKWGGASLMKNLSKTFGARLDGIGGDAAKALAYLRERVWMMDYRSLRKRGYYIGSGVIESACKTLVAARCKLAGMHWRHKNAAGIALLRATLRSNFRIAA